MQHSIDAVNKKEMGCLKAATNFVNIYILNGQELIRNIKLLKTRLSGFTCNQVKKLAIQLPEKNGIVHWSSKEDEMVGRPGDKSAARAQAFNKPQIDNYFKTLDRVITEHNIQPTRIWNLKVQKAQKIFITKERKHVGAVTNAEREQHVTCVVCMSSAGSCIPPAFIFCRKNWEEELLDRAPHAL
ncbi:hypothetical protein PR048_003199 [Dryococelus australis]|uniref:Uncharacterized protein n=1 Tax=Dryococelus australis TaxID=614101 RepID=A0ABQ9INC9_9NEOP|nr:hypothetical protein PR048_003199 [Dryococelus australis]